jgi:Winged helix-turn helix
MPSSLVVPIELSDVERERLEAWSRRPSSAQGLAQRPGSCCLCAEGRKTSEICRELRIHRNTVVKWRERFAAERLEGLLDEPRPGQPRKITDAQVEEVIVTTLESQPRTRRIGRRGRWPERSG